MTTIVERPYTVSWSKNPVQYIFQTDSPAAAGPIIEVKIYFHNKETTAWEMVAQQALYPDSYGLVYFRIESILDALLEYQVPDPNELEARKLRKQSGNYYIQYREVTTLLPNPEWISDAANPGTVIKGGIGREQWDGANYFSSTEKNFLTWQQSGRLCGLQEVMFLSFIVPRLGHDQAWARVKIRYIDGTEHLLSVQVLGSYDLRMDDVVCIPVGPAQLQLEAIDPARKIYWYEISVEDAIGPLVFSYRYVIDYRHTYTNVQLNYINSLGGLDSVRLLGEITPESKREANTGGVETPARYMPPGGMLPQETTSGVVVTTEYKGSAGQLSKKEAEYLRDMMHSKNVFELKKGRFRPVVITNTAIPHAKEGDDLFTLDIQWRNGWGNQQFTPDFKDIQALPTCPVVTGLEIVPGDDPGTKKVQWLAAAAHTGYIVRYRLVSGDDGTPVVGIKYVNTPQCIIPAVPAGGTVWVTSRCAYNTNSAEVSINVT